MKLLKSNPRSVLGLILFVSILVSGPLQAQDRETVRIGIVTDGPVQRENNFVDLYRSELERVTAGSFDVVFPVDAIVNGAWDPKQISTTISNILGRNDLDVILAVGVGSAAEVCQRGDTAIPVVAPFAIKDCLTACPQFEDSRIRSIDLGNIIASDLRTFYEIKPFNRIAILIDPTWPEDCSIDELLKLVTPPSATAELVVIDSEDSIIEDVTRENFDAVYLMPLLQLNDAVFSKLVDRLTQRGLPTFSMIGETEVDQGVFAGLNTRATMSAIARGSALDMLDLLEGRESNETMLGTSGGQLTLNMVTAKALNFDPSWELLTKARLLHDQGFRNDRPIDLTSAMRRAVTANLDLAVRDRRVAAGAEDIRSAKAEYRPQLDLGLSGVAIDENHAMSALGQYPLSASGSLTLNQLIYSDAASANITIQKDLQKARKFDWDSLSLDIGRDAVAAYMNVMRTNALIRVRQQQVELTSTNLELARLRRSLGTTGAAEIYRWEAELATARAGLLEALSQHRQTERQLSRLLDEPITTRWSLREPEIASSLAILGGENDAALLKTPHGYDQLTTSLVNQSLDQAPELAALDVVIAAQERILQTTRRARYAPTVGLQANLSQILAKDETGGLDLGDIGDLIPEFDDTSWNIGVQARLPLLTGGKIKAQNIKAREELHALRIDRRNVEEKLSQRTLSALDTVVASYSSIALRRQAADAAVQTLELVRDAYARGAASILDVLDAQNNSLTAQLAAKTSVYDFLDDWAEVQRSVAGFETALSMQSGTQR